MSKCIYFYYRSVVFSAYAGDNGCPIALPVTDAPIIASPIEAIIKQPESCAQMSRVKYLRYSGDLPLILKS